MKKLWKWLNGKKTTISAILWLITAAFVLATGQHITGFTAPETWGEYASIVFAMLAGTMSGGGLLHKAKKWVDAEPEITESDDDAEINS